MKHEIQPVAMFGDLVTCVGYGSDLFAVDEYYYEYRYAPGINEVTVVFDLTCVYGNSGYIIGEQEDVTLACKAEKADAFLQAYKPAPTAEDSPSVMRSIYFAIGNGGELEMQTKQSKAKTPTTRQRIDALLDERNDVLIAAELIGDEAGYKQRRLDEIDAQLRELTE